ncbi:MAG: YCF48-related protein [Candidatus Acidiferrales bacterium]
MKERLSVGREDDKSIPGMLRRGLAADAAVMVGEQCPRPEVLAAYFDRALEAEEVARYDLHFSRCAACRQQLAAMARAGSGTGDEANAASGWRWLTGTRWLAPAAVSFAVLVLVVAGIVLDMRRRDLASEVAMSRASGAPRAAARNSANSAGTSTAEPNEQRATPAPPLSKAAGEDQLSSSASAKTKASEEMYRQALAMASRNKQIEAEQAAKAKNTPSSGTGVAGSTSSADNVVVSEPDASPGVPLNKASHSASNGQAYSIEVGPDEGKKSDAKERRPHPGENAKQPPGPAASGAAPAPSASAGAAAVSARAPAPATQAPNATAAAPRATMSLSMKARANDQAAQMARVQEAEISSNLAGLEIATPDPKVLWVVSDSGAVMRSDDAGATWKYGRIPNEDHFVAGSAPATKICWLVGVRGTILRTIDGKTWASVSPPSEAGFVGFSRVEAKDELTATVTTVDGQKFSTSDGGKTWKLTK